MVGEKCTLTFPNAPEDFLQMLTVASSFPIPSESDLMGNLYTWTGIQGLSHESLHDIVYFIKEDFCKEGVFAYDDVANKPVLSCNTLTESLEDQDLLPLLGNFNYDVARSHQSYNLPIYGLKTADPFEVRVTSHEVDLGDGANEVAIRNVTAHHGHGSIIDDVNDIFCDNFFQYILNVNDQPLGTIGHHGELEYANFYLCEDPFGPFHPEKPDQSAGDYNYKVPSSWTTTIVSVP